VRGSVISAQAIKRDSQQIVDSIVAEDIGKLPDNSVAAALQRVTGVQVSRSDGEANEVLVRGLPQTVTTLNGRNIFTTTGRGVALADIPADLLKQVDVKKTANPEDITGGIAGLINIELRRPFDFDDGLTIAGGLRGQYSELAESTDPIASLTVNNNWSAGAGDFGAMLSLSFQDRQFEEHTNFITEPVIQDITDPRSVTPPNPGEPILMPNVIGNINRHGDRNRTSANGALQWSPNDSLELYSEFFYVEFDQDSESNFWVPLPTWGGPAGFVTEFKDDDEFNVVSKFSRDNAPGTITSNQSFQNESETLQLAVGGTWTSGNWQVDTDFAYTDSEADNQSFILDLVFFAPQVDFDFAVTDKGGSDTAFRNADGTPFDLFDPNAFELNQFFDQRSRQEGEEFAWQTDVQYNFNEGFLHSAEFGFRISQRDAFNQSADTGGVPNASGGRVPLTDFPGLVDKSPSGFMSGELDLNISQWLTPNADFLLENRTDIRVAMGHDPLPEGAPFIPELFFDNQEDTYAAYAKLNYETEVAGMRLDGQVGGRFVRLDSDLEGTINVEGELVPANESSTDDRFLASASARLALTEELYLRGSFSQTITRPGFNQLNPATAFFLPTPTTPDLGTGTGGNPELDAVESDNFDVSLEWYFSDTGSLTAAYFFRDVTGFIQEFASEEEFDGIMFNVTRPQNSGSGDLQGVELAYTQFFDMLPGFWSGFGFQANGTYIDGETESVPDEDGNTTDIPFANVSETYYNLILLYEKERFSARLAYNWRDGFTDLFNVGGDQPGNTVVEGSTESLDLALNYDINDNFTLLLEATNLTEDSSRDYFGGGTPRASTLFPRDRFLRERTFLFGGRFRF